MEEKNYDSITKITDIPDALRDIKYKCDELKFNIKNIWEVLLMNGYDIYEVRYTKSTENSLVMSIFIGSQFSKYIAVRDIINNPEDIFIISQKVFSENIYTTFGKILKSSLMGLMMGATERN